MNTRWSKSLELLPYEIGGNDTTEHMWLGEVVSCGYAGLLATGPDRFLVIYSDFQHRNEAGKIRKAIKVREVRSVCGSPRLYRVATPDCWPPGQIAFS